MGFLDSLLGLFGATPDFGRLDPNNVEHFWDAEMDIDAAERAEGAGQVGALAQAYARWGLRDGAHWGRVKDSLSARHAENPAFAAAAARVSMRRQMAQVQQAHGAAAMAHPMAPAAGLSLHDLARAQVIRERCGALPEFEIQRRMAMLAIDTQSLPAAQHEWSRRMDPTQNPGYAGAIRAQYASFLAQYRARP